MSTSGNLSSAGRSIKIFEHGTDIFAQAGQADYLYVIISGSVHLLHAGRKVMELGPDAVIGAEPLFIPGSGYLYSAKAAGTVRVSRYDYTAVLDMMPSRSGLMNQLLISVCAQAENLWSGASASVCQIPELHFLGEVRAYSQGELVIKEGDDDKDIFRIVSSEKGLQVSRSGRQLAVLDTPGDFFGEMASILDEKRTATVRSIGRSVLEVYPGDQLQNILADYPQVAMRIVKTLSQRLAETTRALAGSG